MRVLLIVAIGFFLSGCATPTLMNATPRQVSVMNVKSYSLGAAQGIAEQWCNKYEGRHAVYRPDNTPDGVAHYECVK